MVDQQTTTAFILNHSNPLILVVVIRYAILLIQIPYIDSLTVQKGNIYIYIYIYINFSLYNLLYYEIIHDNIHPIIMIQ